MEGELNKLGYKTKTGEAWTRENLWLMLNELGLKTKQATSSCSIARWRERAEELGILPDYNPLSPKKDQVPLAPPEHARACLYE
jgi:hypothetical protein